LTVAALSNINISNNFVAKQYKKTLKSFYN